MLKFYYISIVNKTVDKTKYWDNIVVLIIRPLSLFTTNKV